MTFGPMPIANGFLPPDELDGEHFFELEPAFCENCCTFQIVTQPDAAMMFHEGYAFQTRTSEAMKRHFSEYGDWLRQNYVDAEGFIVEIGSNDGVMLETFAKKDIRHLGVEPSANVAEIARSFGVECVTEFFSSEAAERIRASHGPADAIAAANVMCHIPDMPDIAAAAAILLAERGVLVFEEPYLGDMVRLCSFDQIYDEHVFIFSALSVSNAFSQAGLELIDVLPQVTHGGSMRYVLARKGVRNVAPAVEALLTQERALGLDRAATFGAFRARCEEKKKDLRELLITLKAEGKRVAGYGATSKSTTMLNYAGIGPDLIEFISDSTPIKQGKVTPGTHVPVDHPDRFHADLPDYALLLAWNHKAEIMKKETAFLKNGGHWIVYVPEVALIGPDSQ